MRISIRLAMAGKENGCLAEVMVGLSARAHGMVSQTFDGVRECKVVRWVCSTVSHLWGYNVGA
jgi:hypothetical protein